MLRSRFVFGLSLRSALSSTRVFAVLKFSKLADSILVNRNFSLGQKKFTPDLRIDQPRHSLQVCLPLTFMVTLTSLNVVTAKI